MAIVAILTLAVKIVSFFKETLVASSFGLSLVLDTYFIAILIPSAIQNIFISALRNLFIPNYILEMKTNNDRGGFQLFAMLSITVISILLSIIAISFVEFFLEIAFPGHSEEYYGLIRKQFYYVLPCLFIWGFSSFFGGLLEIKEKFFVSTLAQFLMPITVIVFVLFLRDVFGDYVLVISLTIGSLLALLYRIIAAVHYKAVEFGKITINSNIRMMVRQYVPKVTSGLLVGINPFVDQFFAAQLVVGSISAINYGIKIPQFLVSIMVIALGNVLLPHFSKVISDNLKKGYRQLFSIMRYVFILTAMVALVVIVFSDDIVRILFERNNFTSNDTYVVANIQRIALIYVPFYICTNVMVKFLTAINQNVFMAWTSFLKLILNIILNIILIQYFGVYGLVLATTIVLIIASLIYLYHSYKGYKKLIASEN